ncbi:hypothetical protein IMSAG185_01740 [Lachnospiraceae bacterium]|nr:hypothetical protein IMSAG185_01740 [Lachnospiraceae bacterium]
MERKISHKVGVKLFSEAQLENVLPTYRNLFHKIETCRSVAQEELRQENKRNYQYNFMYDNVFSIMGKRGTGKTSVVFTLQNMILEKYGRCYNDVVLPLIIPEAIPDNCTVLGWILAIVKEEVKKLENRVKKQEVYRESGQCRYLDRNRSEEGLSARLEALSQLFYAGSYNPSNEVSYYRAAGNSALQTVDYYRFAHEIAGFWDAWVQEICYLRKLEGGEPEGCPLIYFIFDDVDLAPEKIDEILSVIIKYLSHPNLIVVTTADEELFLEVIEKRLDRNIGRIPGEWRSYLLNVKETKYIAWNSREEEEQKKAEDIVSRTTRMYLGKVLPSSTRYYLRLFHTAKQKQVFCLEEQKDLGNGMAEQVDQLLEGIRKSAACSKTDRAPQSKNFMRPDVGVVNFYLKFMGDTSRQIGNVYIALKELIKNIIDVINEGDKRKDERQKTLSSVYQDSRYFLCVSIRANHELTEIIEYVDDFVDEVFLQEYNQWKMYINYAFLNEFLRKSLSGENKQRRVEIGLALYSLVAFLENLLLIMENGIAGGITGRKKIHTVQYLTEYIERVAFEERHVFRDDMAPEQFFMHYSNLLDRLAVIVTDEMSDMKFNMEYFYEFTTYKYRKLSDSEELLNMGLNNRKWFGELTGMLFMVYGNIYLFDKANMEKCLVYADMSCLTDYQRVIQAFMRNRLRDCLRLAKLQEGWNPNTFETAISVTEDTKDFYTLVQSIKQTFHYKGKEYAGLAEILELVDKLCRRTTDNPLVDSPFKYCSQAILNDIKSNRNRLGERRGKERLLREFIQKIRKAGHSLGKNAIIFDMENVIRKLEQLARLGYYWSQQRASIMEKVVGLKEYEPGSILAPKNVYSEIVRVFSSVLEETKGMESGPFEEEAITQDEVEEILAHMDIAIYLGDEEELVSAVELGLRVLAAGYLECAYFYQTIAERYADGNNKSSKNLEKTDRDGEKIDTYYYHLNP